MRELLHATGRGSSSTAETGCPVLHWLSNLWPQKRNCHCRCTLATVLPLERARKDLRNEYRITSVGAAVAEIRADRSSLPCSPVPIDARRVGKNVTTEAGASPGTDGSAAPVRKGAPLDVSADGTGRGIAERPDAGTDLRPRLQRPGLLSIGVCRWRVPVRVEGNRVPRDGPDACGDGVECGIFGSDPRTRRSGSGGRPESSGPAGDPRSLLPGSACCGEGGDRASSPPPRSAALARAGRPRQPRKLPVGEPGRSGAATCRQGPDAAPNEGAGALTSFN